MYYISRILVMLLSAMFIKMQYSQDGQLVLVIKEKNMPRGFKQKTLKGGGVIYLLQSIQICTPLEIKESLYSLNFNMAFTSLLEVESPVLINPLELSCVVSKMSLMLTFCQPLLWKCVQGWANTDHQFPFPLLKNVT